LPGQGRFDGIPFPWRMLAAILPRHAFELREDSEAVRDFALAKLSKSV
jgi:hypothetical protein